MMKKFTLFTFVFLFACVGFALAQSEQENQPEQQPPQEQQMPAQEQQTPAQAQPSPVAQSQQLSGEIQKIDLEKKTITIKDELSKTSQECNFTDTTTFSRGGQTVTAGELKKGDRVSLEVDSQNVATKIQIEAPEATPPPEQKQ